MVHSVGDASFANWAVEEGFLEELDGDRNDEISMGQFDTDSLVDGYVL